LAKADLTGADLTGADLTAAFLIGANLAGANLEDANLEGLILTDARYDPRTRWPVGFDPQRHGVLLYDEVPAVDGAFPHPRGEYPELISLFAAWSASAWLHQWKRPATEMEIAEAESALGGPLLPELRALYEATNGLYLLSGNLNIYPLIGLVHETNEEREAGMLLPDELCLFGGASEHLFGLWLPHHRRSAAAVPVIEVGELFEPRCMAVAGTDLVRFLTTRTVHYLMTYADTTEALDLLGVPVSLRSPDPSDELKAALTRWTDPELADPEPDPNERGLNADELRERYGTSAP
jgi:hypothetical protein